MGLIADNIVASCNNIVAPDADWSVRQPSQNRLPIPLFYQYGHDRFQSVALLLPDCHKLLLWNIIKKRIKWKTSSNVSI